jgi:phosphotransacetylase
VHFFVFEQVGERAKSLDSEWSEFERVAPELDLTLEEDAATFWADLMSRSGVAVESISTGEAFN